MSQDGFMGAVVFSVLPSVPAVSDALPKTGLRWVYGGSKRERRSSK